MKRWAWVLFLLALPAFGQVTNPNIVVSIRTCAADPPVGACATGRVCVDDTNELLYACIATAWVQLGTVSSIYAIPETTGRFYLDDTDRLVSVYSTGEDIILNTNALVAQWKNEKDFNLAPVDSRFTIGTAASERMILSRDGLTFAPAAEGQQTITPNSALQVTTTDATSVNAVLDVYLNADGANRNLLTVQTGTSPSSLFSVNSSAGVTTLQKNSNTTWTALDTATGEVAWRLDTNAAFAGGADDSILLVEENGADAFRLGTQSITFDTSDAQVGGADTFTVKANATTQLAVGGTNPQIRNLAKTETVSGDQRFHIADATEYQHGPDVSAAPAGAGTGTFWFNTSCGLWQFRDARGTHCFGGACPPECS